MNRGLKLACAVKVTRVGLRRVTNLDPMNRGLKRDAQVVDDHLGLASYKPRPDE